jgi:phage-related protein
MIQPPCCYLSCSYSDIISLKSADAMHEAGYQLDKVQRGKQPDDFKPMPPIGSISLISVINSFSHLVRDKK